MKESQNKKKTSVVTKAILSLGVVLATTFSRSFNRKWNSIPAKGVANENIRLANTQQQKERGHITGKTEKS